MQKRFQDKSGSRGVSEETERKERDFYSLLKVSFIRQVHLTTIKGDNGYELQEHDNLGAD